MATRSRTSEKAVRKIVNTSTDYSLTPFIETAHIVVDRIESNDSDGVMTAGELEVVERWLSAHFYSIQDQMLSARSTEGASGTFQGTTAMYLESTTYGQQAILLDETGYLENLNKKAKAETASRATASMVWLGKEANAGNIPDA